MFGVLRKISFLFGFEVCLCIWMVTVDFGINKVTDTDTNSWHCYPLNFSGIENYNVITLWDKHEDELKQII